MADLADESPAAVADPLRLADRVVRGGYFVTRRNAPKRSAFSPAPSNGDASAAYSHCFTYAGGGSSIRTRLIDMIEGAEQKIFVGVLCLGDKELREALVKAVGRLRGGVYVVSALDNKGLEQSINDDTSDVDRQMEYRNFRELTRHGIYVRGYPGLHAKFVVVDDRVALVSSANLVSRSFDNVGENGVVVTGRDDVLGVARLFARLWQLSPWDMPPDRRTHPVQSRTAASDLAVPSPAGPGTGPLWTWGEQCHIADAVTDVIDRAKSELLLATFSVASMTYGLPRAAARPELLYEPVCRAVDRGVRVSLLLRGRNHLPAARAEATAFSEAGVEIVPDRLNHAKGVIADGVTGALFSANFVAKQGLTGGVELGMRLDGTHALAEATRYFKHVMNEANMSFVRDATAGELAGTLYAEALTPWPFPPTLRVVADGEHWTRLGKQHGMALYEHAEAGLIKLYIGRTRWTLLEVDGRWLLTPDEQGSGKGRAADIFESWLTRERTPKGTRRGLCPATLLRVDP